MAEDDDRSPLMDALDKSEEVATTIGLVASGMIFAAGVAALLFVINHVVNAPPPQLGTQGEWLYGGIACLLVAGWGFNRAASLYARRRSAITRDRGITPRIQVRPDGFSIEVGAPRPDPAQTKTWAWSFSSTPAPLKMLKLDEAQLAAAVAEARSGVDWDTVCRKISPEYIGLSAFEQQLFRQAVQAAVENQRRGGTQS